MTTPRPFSLNRQFAATTPKAYAVRGLRNLVLDAALTGVLAVAPWLLYLAGERLTALTGTEFSGEALGAFVILDFALVATVFWPILRRTGGRLLRWALDPKATLSAYRQTIIR